MEAPITHITQGDRPRPARRVLAVILTALAVMSAGGTALFGLAFYHRYWRWRDCFNELGRCYDPDSQDVYLEQAGIVWGTFAAMCVICMVIAALVAWRTWRPGPS